MSEPSKHEKPVTAGDSNPEFKINRSVPRPLMYYHNTSTYSDATRLLMRRVERTDSLPVPPPHLMQYQESRKAHLNSGLAMAKTIRTTLADNEIVLGDLKNVMEFGCANARVLRHFEDMTESNNYWGCDINANTILWNIENLSPPFQFFVNTTQPNLPFRDSHFDFVFANSVFTHMDDMLFGWLLEMKRIVRDGGYLFLTFLNEGSVRFGLENPNRPVGKQIINNRELIDGLMDGTYNMVVINRDAASMTYIREDFLRENLGRLFEIVAVVEKAMAGHQTGFLLKNI